NSCVQQGSACGGPRGRVRCTGLRGHGLVDRGEPHRRELYHDYEGDGYRYAPTRDAPQVLGVHRRGSDLVYFAHARSDGFDPQVLVKVARQLHAALLLAVDGHELGRSLYRLEVGREDALPTVRREVELPHGGPDLRGFAVYQGQAPVDEGPPRGAGNLEADQRDPVLLLEREPLVVEHGRPTDEHPRRSDDNP